MLSVRQIIILLAAACCFTNAQAQSLQPFYLQGEAQGTTYQITYFDSLERNYTSEILGLLVDFDASVSLWDKNSILSRTNRNDPNVSVDSIFLACFKRAKTLWELTEGAFDPTVLPLVTAWGWGPTPGDGHSKAQIDSMLAFVGFSKVKLDGNKVVKQDPRLQLDFNAFAQGYSVDLVAGFLENHGVFSYLIEIGGEVRAGNCPPNELAWKVGLESPLDNKISKNPELVRVNLVSCSVATSGNNRKFFEEDGIRYAHHLDPKTGYPAKNNLLAVSVFTQDCMDADALATGILVMGYKKAMRFLKKHPEVQVILVYSDSNGEQCVFSSKGMESKISKE